MTVVEQIVARQIDAVIVYESARVIAFADHEPINPGHLLIAPVQPYASFIDLPADVLEEIQSVAKQLYVRLEQKFAPDGISFIQNNGFFNELNHYHLHIFPRFKDDQFGWQSRDGGIRKVSELSELFADF